MADPITALFSFQIGGVPVVPFVIIIFVAYLLINQFRKGKKTFKKKELIKEVKNDNDSTFKGIAVKSGKKLCYGYHDIGCIDSYIHYKEKPILIKNKKGKLVIQMTEGEAKLYSTNKAIENRNDRINALEKSTLSEDAVTRASEKLEINLKVKELKEDIEKLKIEKEDAENAVKGQKVENILCFKVRNMGIIARIIAYLNLGFRYYLIDEELITQSSGEVIINPTAEHTNFLGVAVFSKKAREIVENIAFKINRESELEAFINFLPKMEFLETDVAGSTAILREKAWLEKEKWKSQSEGGGND